MEFNLEVRANDGVVYTNAKDLLPAIEEGLTKYNYVVDEGNYAQAKKDRAALNSLVKTVSDKRKQVENDVFKEWLQDKKDIMAIEKKIKASADTLGEGISLVDESDKDLKKSQIRELWTTISNDKYPFESVFEERYLNKSTSAGFIEEALTSKFKRAEEEFTFLQALLPQDELQKEQVLDVYYKTLDLLKAKEKIEELKEIHEKMQAKVNQQIEESKQAQAKRLEQEAQNAMRASESAQIEQNEVEPNRYCIFKFSASYSTLKAFNPILNQFMREHKDLKIEILEKGEE